MQSTQYQVLVAEDFEPFRKLILELLREVSGLEIVGHAHDGLEAVQKAAELRPHLILLDIGLPLLNGLDAARLIRKLSPNSRILFVSQETSAGVVQEAMRLGAAGYVMKSTIGRDLRAAIESVIQGNQFVSLES